MNSVRIALAQTEIAFENYEENMGRARKYIQQAKAENADLILFPEMSFTGFSMNIDVTSQYANQTSKDIAEAATKNSICIGYGWTEGGKLAKNHYSIINENGLVICDYVKMHPFSYSGEDQYFEKGQEIVSVTIKDISIGLFICYDLRFPEIFQVSSNQNHIILVPANWPKRRQAHWDILTKARAIENQVYFVGINCVGMQKETVYTGGSVIINPYGEELAGCGLTEKMIVYEVEDDVTEIRESFPTKRDRRVDLYSNLLNESRR